MKRSLLASAARWVAVLCAVAASAGAHAAAACQQTVGCTEVRSFTATVTNFRTTAQGANRLVTLSIRFQNRTDKPLTLGYVADSGLIIDDLGNRYGVWGPGAIRGIGEIRNNIFDPKFTLQPHEASDARFELLWKHAGNTIAGTTFELDLAVREIVPVTGDVFKLGQEYALHYAAIDEATLAAAKSAAPPALATATAPAMAAATARPVPAADPCAGLRTCFNAGPFVAEVQQVTPTNATGARHHALKLVIRFRNVSNAPVVLAYKGNTSQALDNYGNAYYWGRSGTHDTSVQGIGFITGRGADPQFVLNPGQARTATFGVVRYNAHAPIGTSFQYDVVINELEVLPSQQVRSLRENSLSFAHLTAGTFNMAQLPGVAQLPGMPAATGVPANGADDVAAKMIDLINTVTKKKK